jgi:hypothetical protein
MRGRLFLLAILVVAPVVAFGQSPKPRTHSTITGCLSSTGHPDEYQLVNEKRVTNLIYTSDSLSPLLEINLQCQAH